MGIVPVGPNTRVVLRGDLVTSDESGGEQVASYMNANELVVLDFVIEGAIVQEL